MDEYGSSSHTRWDDKYHIGFIPKCLWKALYGDIRRHLGEVFSKLVAQKESLIEEGHLMPDRVHMMISTPPKYAVSQVVGYTKGEERDPFGPGLCGASAQFCGTALLGSRIFLSRP